MPITCSELTFILSIKSTPAPSRTLPIFTAASAKYFAWATGLQAEKLIGESACISTKAEQRLSPCYIQGC